MNRTQAASIAKELVEAFDEDIVTTCEGVPEDIVKVRAEVIAELTKLNLRATR